MEENLRAIPLVQQRESRQSNSGCFHWHDDCHMFGLWVLNVATGSGLVI